MDQQVLSVRKRSCNNDLKMKCLYTSCIICRYPVGHPTIITKDFKNLNDYFGIAKVKILPPKEVYHPVLPYRSQGKLKFPLCATCAERETDDPCDCKVEDRVLIGTWCTPEIQKALECGYELQTVYEVYHWDTVAVYDREEGTEGLFTGFINTFLKLKQESSGWPAWCETEADRQKYVIDYGAHEGIDLNPDNIAKNPGRGSLPKLILNR